MTKHSIKKLPKYTLEILLDIPWETIKQEYDKSFTKLMGDLTVEGFRKGKAPREVAEKNIPKDRVYDTMIRNYVPKEYEEIVKKEGLKPIYQPKIELVNAKENEDWQVKFLVPTKPDIDIKKYKDIVKKAKDEASKPEIWTPGKALGPASENEKPPEANATVKKEMAIQAALNALLDNVEVELSDVILDEEINARLMKLVEDLQKMGLSVEQYVQSRNTTVESMRGQFRKEISETYKLEFILSEIAEQEKLTVEKEDLEAFMANLKDEKDKQAFMQNAYYYASILRKQKVLDHIANV
jgi:trigger factor